MSPCLSAATPGLAVQGHSGFRGLGFRSFGFRGLGVRGFKV